jgi:hypothetical protein
MCPERTLDELAEGEELETNTLCALVRDLANSCEMKATHLPNSDWAMPRLSSIVLLLGESSDSIRFSLEDPRLSVNRCRGAKQPDCPISARWCAILRNSANDSDLHVLNSDWPMPRLADQVIQSASAWRTPAIRHRCRGTKQPYCPISGCWCAIPGIPARFIEAGRTPIAVQRARCSAGSMCGEHQLHV